MKYEELPGVESDWKEAFKYAKDFIADDIATVQKAVAGENDEESWVAYGQLKNRRWWYLTAWCDYTGWG